MTFDREKLPPRRRESARKSPPKRAAERKYETADEINYDSVALYMRDRLPDREHASRPEVCQLLTELVDGGVRTLGEIDIWFDKHWKELKEDEQTCPPHDESGEDTLYTNVGVVRRLMFMGRPDIYDQKVAQPARKVIEQMDLRARRRKSKNRSSRTKPKN